MPEASFTLFVALTTVNFPDVMLPYFNTDEGGVRSAIAATYFVAFYVIGLYFLMNLLLVSPPHLTDAAKNQKKQQAL